MIWKGIKFAPVRQVDVVVSNNKYIIYIIIYGQEQKFSTGNEQLINRQINQFHKNCFYWGVFVNKRRFYQQFFPIVMRPARVINKNRE